MNDTFDSTTSLQANFTTDSNDQGVQASTDCREKAIEPSSCLGSEGANPQALQTSSEIKHLVCEVSADISAKRDALLNIIECQRPNFAVVYSSGRSDIDFVETILRRAAFATRRLNSSLPNGSKKLLAKLDTERVQILVSNEQYLPELTGKDVDLVINFSLPENSDVYTKRIAVAHNQSKPLTVITLVAPKEFSSFHSVKRGCDYTFDTLELPGSEALIAAQLTRLDSLVNTNVELKDQDRALARAFLTARLPEEASNAALTDLTAALLHSLVEKQLNTRTLALEEEIDTVVDFESTERGNLGYERRGDRRESGYERRRDGRDNYRHERYNDRRSDSRNSFSDHPRREERGRRDHDDRRDRRYRDRREDFRDDHHHSTHRDSHERFSTTSDNRESRRNGEISELRLYIGQGTVQGMTADLFTQLAENMGEVGREDLKRISFRDHYGYVDLCEEKAIQLINNLNGIEYNGAVLPVQRATTLGKRRVQE